MKCRNFDCSNILTDFEIKRQLPNKFNKYKFCRKCRNFTYKIHRVFCEDCNKSMMQQGQKLYCDKCANERTKKTSRELYQKRKLLNNPKGTHKQ